MTLVKVMHRYDSGAPHRIEYINPDCITKVVPPYDNHKTYIFGINDNNSIEVDEQDYKKIMRAANPKIIE
ncbi:MAG: hypothetical protein IJH43_05545 [Mogibacterium sp.]|nr:hypothetical protein [Mogibacterium sp.]